MSPSSLAFNRKNAFNSIATDTMSRFSNKIDDLINESHKLKTSSPTFRRSIMTATERKRYIAQSDKN